MLYLQCAIDIADKERDGRKWPALIAQLPEAARDPCRRWLLRAAQMPDPATSPGKRRGGRTRRPRKQPETA